MASLSLYENKQSFLNSLSPISKMVYVLAIIVIPLLVDQLALFGVTILLSASLLAHSRVLRKALPMLGISGFIIFTVAIVQGIFNPNNARALFSLGGITFYQEGLLFALGVTLNVCNIILAFCVLVLTTKSSDMIEDLVRMGFSPRFGYVFVSLFQLIPQMTSRISTITDAQRSRGMETEGSLFVRMKAFLPLISPVIMSSFIDTKERALALEVRGFNARNPKTFLNAPIRSKHDGWIQLLCVLGLLGALIWRFI
ncbi:energy-coupling factor transporter transmembrane component T family protein [Streptococcus sp. DD13]|uniref:energy-coupling factor transporter transmembrane component T family protein n=1 Tax=Streptococcus sp. DD13 TaxID=1777881 RepID=UPI000795E97A|nr:energy-coupling factor transporter transmembrane component T [Streptococcus sp. DD13]KXT78447.1 Transmembrane component of energizing module of queuosine-regulated ECF transporter [Streptococcus sp. DD13]